MGASIDTQRTTTDPSGRWCVGLDVGGTKVHGVLLDGVPSDGAPADSAASPTSVPLGVPQVLAESRLPTRRGPAGVVETAALVVEELARLAGITVDAVATVGVGIPGVVDPVTGEVQHAVNVGVDGPTPLAELLSARLGGVPVHVDNDLNAAAVGAAHLLPSSRPARGGAVGGLGAGPRPADLAFLALGTGVAAGLVLDGVVRRGATGAAGEIGHVPVVPGGLLCPCGQRGCLERYASGGAIDAAWAGRGPRPAPLELFEAARAGDPEAVQVRDTFAAAVAAAVRILVLTCDVERVVIGGGVSNVGTMLLEAVRRALTDQATESSFLRSRAMADRVELAPVDVPVAAIGAALLGLTQARAARQGAVNTKRREGIV